MVPRDTKRRPHRRLDVRDWPAAVGTLGPQAARRSAEIIDWADEHNQTWLFDFLESRTAHLLEDDDSEAQRRQIPREDYLAIHFNLTPAQAKVLCAFLGGQTLQEIADALAIKINTVRTHFVQIREKLGARDQADVVRIGLLGGRDA